MIAPEFSLNQLTNELAAPRRDESPLAYEWEPMRLIDDDDDDFFEDDDEDDEEEEFEDDLEDD